MSLLLTACASPRPHRLPTGFPAAVPVVSGHVLAAKRADGEWYAWVRSADPLTDYRRAKALLLRAHYETTHDDETAGGSDGQFCSPRYCVNITGYLDPTYGRSVMYEVFRTTGMAAVG